MTSEAIKALAKAQTEMGKAIKNAKNPHLKSSYADLGSVMEACFDALHANGFAIMQPCGADERGQFVETTLAHESGHHFTSRVHLAIGKNDMQAVGSAITYARRYGLLGMAGLAPEDDDGEATKSAPRPTAAPRNERQTSPSEKHRAIAEKMIGGVRAVGERAWSDPNFIRDLDGLRKHAPELAAHVEAEIETKKQGRAA